MRYLITFSYDGTNFNGYQKQNNLKTKKNVLIKNIKINSKEIKKGDMFVCIKVVNTDRHDFIYEAIKN